MKIILITSYVQKYQKKIVGVVELDSGESLKLEPDTIMQFQLQTGSELDEKKLREVLAADQKKKKPSESPSSYIYTPSQRGGIKGPVQA